MSHFNEHALELFIMELFQQEGYIYTRGEEIHKEADEVLLRDDMRTYLRNRYREAGITSLEIESVLARLTANAGWSLYDNNAQTYRLMTEGFSLKREDAALPDLFIEPIDFSEEGRDNNLFRVVNQLEIKGTEKRIPDGIVYVNGLPVVVLEFKSAVKEDTTIMDAYTQLTVRYRRDIPELFKYNAFVVISDGVNNKYGLLFSPYDFFYTWRKVEANDKATDGINSLLTIVKGLFRKERLLSVIKDFVFFPDSSKNEKKVVCRYPQFFATHKLFENIRLHSKLREGGDGKGGTYFGATGCGKSITMLFLSRMLMRSREFASPTIVLITDRTDLDDQLSKLFGTAKNFIGDECVIDVESRDKLREYLTGRTSGGVFLTTIHKFTEDTRLLSKRANIICISDEAHRSQTNLAMQVKQTEKGVRRNFGFAKYLHDSLPNATYVGFTGTPIDATIEVFGEVVDAYTMTESVTDGITRRIVYEGRAAKVLLDNKKLQEIEKYYAQCAEEGANEYQIEESKKAVTKMERILGDADRLQAVAEDFIAHYEKRVEEGSTVEGKAMFVCSNRTIAFSLYKKIALLRPEWVKKPGGATISELARQWQWQRATVRQFISGLTKLGQLSVEPYSKSFIFSVNLEQRLSLLIESPDDILDFCAMQFIRFIKGRSTTKEVAESYSRYYDLKMNMAKQEGCGGIPEKRVLNQQAQVFNSLAVSILRYLNQEKELPEELSDSVSLLFGKDHVWDWHKVIDSLGILAKAISGNTKPSYMDEVVTRYSKAEIVLLDCIFEHYISGSASHYYVNPPRPLTEAREPSEKIAPAESSDD